MEIIDGNNCVVIDEHREERKDVESICALYKSHWKRFLNQSELEERSYMFENFKCVPRTLEREKKIIEREEFLLQEHLREYLSFENNFNMSKHVEYNCVKLKPNRDKHTRNMSANEWRNMNSRIVSRGSMVEIGFVSEKMCWITVFGEGSKEDDGYIEVDNKTPRKNYEIDTRTMSKINMNKLIEGMYDSYFFENGLMNTNAKLSQKRHGVKANYIVSDINFNQYGNFVRLDERRIQVKEEEEQVMAAVEEEEKIDVKVMDDKVMEIVWKQKKIIICNDVWEEWVKDGKSEEKIETIFANIKDITEKDDDILLNIYNTKKEFECTIIYQVNHK